MIALKRIVDWWNSRGELKGIPFRVGSVESTTSYPYVYLTAVICNYNPTTRVDANGKRKCKAATSYSFVVVDKKMEDAVALAQLVSDNFDNQLISSDCVRNEHKQDNFVIDNMFLYNIGLFYDAEFELLQTK